MKTLKTIAAQTVHRALAGLLISTSVGSAWAQQPPVILRGGYLFDGVRDTLVPNSGIVVLAGKFMEVGADLGGRNLAGATVIDLAEDEYVLPGMFDLHAHYAIDLFGRGRVDERLAYPKLFLANGVTSTFPAGEMNPDEMRELRMRIDRGEDIGPRIFNTGPYFGTWRPGWDTAMTVEQLNHEVDYWASRGVRGFKAKGISPHHLRALIERAHMHGLTVTGHLGSGFRNTVNPRDAILMGIDRIEHFLGGDAFTPDKPAYSSLVDIDPEGAAIDSVAALYIRHNVFFDATLSAYGYYGRRDPEVYTYFEDEKKYLTPYMRELLESRPARPINEQFERIYWIKRRTLKAFYDAGGAHLITLGTDHPSWGEYFSGFSVHRELLSFVLSGVPPAQAIKFATANGARALKVGDALGTIEPGKFADLFVVTGNPLADIRNARHVRLVMKGGRVYDAKALLASVEGTIGPAGPGEVDAWQPRNN